MGRRKRWPDRINSTVVSNNCWLPMKDFRARDVVNRRKLKFDIEYFLMARPNGDIVANWYVGLDAGWFHGKPSEFVAWAEIVRPVDGL